MTRLCVDHVTRFSDLRKPEEAEEWVQKAKRAKWPVSPICNIHVTTV